MYWGGGAWYGWYGWMASVHRHQVSGNETYRSEACARIKPVVRRRRVLRVLGIVSLTLIIPRWNVVRRRTLHADVVVGVGKVVLLDLALTPRSNGKDQEQTCESYGARRCSMSQNVLQAGKRLTQSDANAYTSARREHATLLEAAPSRQVSLDELDHG